MCGGQILFIPESTEILNKVPLKTADDVIVLLQFSRRRLLSHLVNLLVVRLSRTVHLCVGLCGLVEGSVARAHGLLGGWLKAVGVFA